MFDHIVVWFRSWLNALIADTVTLDVLKPMRGFEFPAALAHYPPGIVKLALGYFFHGMQGFESMKICGLKMKKRWLGKRREKPSHPGLRDGLNAERKVAENFQHL